MIGGRTAGARIAVLSVAVAILIGVLVPRFADPSSTEAPFVVHAPGKRVLPREAFPDASPAFSQYVVSDRGGIEPPVVFSSSGALFYVVASPSASDRTAKLFKSVDAGRTWFESVPSFAGIPFNNHGIDPYLYRDPITGRIFYVLYGSPNCAFIAWTDDDGDSWHRPINHPLCAVGLGTDYPKLWTSRPTTSDATPAGAASYVHICYDAGLRMECQRSGDGGMTFAPAPAPYPQPFVPGSYVLPPAPNLGECWAHTSPGWAVASPATGVTYMPKAGCGSAEVAISRDNGITWRRVHVADVPGRPTTLLESRLAIDASGNLYLLWMDGQGDQDRIGIGGTTPMLSVSRDGGETWAPALDVGLPGLTAAKYPSIVAGDAGRVAFLYLGTTAAGGFAASEDVRWDAYVGFMHDGSSTEPVIGTAMVNPAGDPLRRGPCSGRCVPDPAAPYSGMYDYLTLALNPTSGRVAASLVDLCLEPCSVPSFVAAVGVEVAGPSLVSEPIR